MNKQELIDKIAEWEYEDCECFYSEFTAGIVEYLISTATPEQLKEVENRIIEEDKRNNEYSRNTENSTTFSKTMFADAFQSQIEHKLAYNYDYNTTDTTDTGSVVKIDTLTKEELDKYELKNK